jgi:radical SAM superfamily enzyme YgiQ (UPF0313 family)
LAFKKILLVKPSGRHGLSFAFDIIPTGLEYLASVVEKDVDHIDIIDLEMEPKPPLATFGKYLDAREYDLVGISMCSTEHTEGLQLARLAKEKGAATVMGGFHPTAIPDELLGHSSVDFVIRGEGELTFHEFVKKGSAVGVKGMSYKEGEKIIHNPDREFIEDLDSIPFPARHLRKYKYKNTLKRFRVHDVITISRGCWGRCSFCCEPSMSKNRQRYRSPENVMKEIREIYDFHGRKPLSLEITDPHFMGKPDIVERLCDLLADAKQDIEFIAKVRPDSMAKHPDVVRKMVAVGIDAYEMGIESPNLRDIISTSKGLKTEVHIEAVRNITKWGGTAGGTFVIGLPDQTEEEILQFPKYAVEIGLTSSAYGIATPYPSTKFYEELDSKGLIFEKDWTRFDEMHSVFRAKYIESKRIEELASICMAKFWTLDRFIEKERICQIKHPGKPSLVEFISDRLKDMRFSVDALSQLQDDNTQKHAEMFFEASPNPDIRRYTQKIGMHNVIEMSRFLRILGNQTIQLRVNKDGAPVASWILRTSKDRFEYIDVIKGKVDNSTINFEIDINDLNFSKASSKRMKLGLGLKILGTNRGIRKQLNLMRLVFAGGTELIAHYRRKNGSGRIRV